jgi:glyoxylase-like metal-dependent hydrolase (beta-lactamase superfamily II)
VTSLEIPATGSAEVHVLHNGYVGLDGDDERVSGTVTLIRDGDAVIVVDPGMVADRDALLAALEAHGPAPRDPLGADQAALADSRKLLLEFADVIIPGHGAPFRPGTAA